MSGKIRELTSSEVDEVFGGEGSCMQISADECYFVTYWPIIWVFKYPCNIQISSCG